MALRHVVAIQPIRHKPGGLCRFYWPTSVKERRGTFTCNMPKFQREKWNRKMPRGRPPTPTYLKLIKGTPRSNRAKRKAAKVDPSLGPPVPPAFLLVEAREEWDAQCGLLHKLGMLTALDAAIFAAYCQAYGRWQRAEWGSQEYQQASRDIERALSTNRLHD